jgi:hypothetical protein
MIDIETYDRHAEKLREELTLARIDRHSGSLDELDAARHDGPLSARARSAVRSGPARKRSCQPDDRTPTAPLTQPPA